MNIAELEDLCIYCKQPLKACICNTALELHTAYPVNEKSGYINPCFSCIEKDCVNCAESLPGAQYQRAWQILRNRIDNDLVDSVTRRGFKKLMHEALKAAKG